MIIEMGQLCYLKNVTFGGDMIEFWKFALDSSSVYRAVECSIRIIQDALYLLFIIARTHEYENLLLFVYYQGNLRLQNLSVERDKYLGLEKKLNRMYTLLTTIFLAPSILTLFAMLIDEIEFYLGAMIY